MELPEKISPPFALHEFSELIDVRSPSEFANDHLPGALNLPVLSDQERHDVGLLYATNPFAARRLGATLITQNIHRHLASSLAQKDQSFAPLIYCARGNLRSQSMAVILRAIGWRARVLEGGYKAWRSFLIKDLARLIAIQNHPFITLAGPTGCGKTILLHNLEKQGAQVLDLEKLAEHRGSILGNPPQSSQPSQKLFESRLWETLRHFDPQKPLFTEAESNRIGSVQCPPTLWKKLAQSRVIVITLPLPDRIQLLKKQYPHFLDDPESLKSRLAHLRRLRGTSLIESWSALINENKWDLFLESILAQHYDLAYRLPGTEDSSYPSPELEIPLPSTSSDSLKKAVAQLLDLAP